MEIQRAPIVIAGQAREWARGTGVTGARGFVFLSGSVGLDPNTGKIVEGAGEQAKLAMENIKAALAEYGSSLKNIVHIWQYVKGQFPNGVLNDPRYSEISNVIEEFWKQNCPEFLPENNPPAETLLGVTSLAWPELHLEIMVVAAIA